LSSCQFLASRKELKTFLIGGNSRVGESSLAFEPLASSLPGQSMAPIRAWGGARRHNLDRGRLRVVILPMLIPSAAPVERSSGGACRARSRCGRCSWPWVRPLKVRASPPGNRAHLRRSPDQSGRGAYCEAEGGNAPSKLGIFTACETRSRTLLGGRPLV
jgi:hypothetical protein